MTKCVTMLSECVIARLSRKDGTPDAHRLVLADYERQQEKYLAQTGEIIWC